MFDADRDRQIRLAAFRWLEEQVERFNNNLIRPDCVAEVRLDVLEEIDGPMPKHWLQEMHGAKLVLPRRSDLRPDPDALERRYEEFQRSA